MDGCGGILLGEPAVQQFRQVREDGVLGDLLEGDEPVQSDGQAYGGQRGATCLVEVGGAEDALDRYFERL